MFILRKYFSFGFNRTLILLPAGASFTPLKLLALLFLLPQD
jgi:hypothetical protein